MKVLDFESIKKYDFMTPSLRFVALGELEEAVISARRHLHETRTAKERLDISLYIAKIYSKMGEIDTAIDTLFKLLILGIEQGRVYAMLAYNFCRLGDMEMTKLYRAMLADWNSRHGDILTVEREYLEDREVKVKDEPLIDEDSVILKRAWDMALSGKTEEARCEAYKISDMSPHFCKKCELVIALDIADETSSREGERLINRLLSTNLEDIDVMNMVYILERAHKMVEIVTLLDRAINEKLPQCRLRYMKAVALYNLGYRDKALNILGRLTRAYGDSNAYMYVIESIIRRYDNLHISIYREGDDEVEAIRDKLVDEILTKDIDDLVPSEMALLKSVYIDGKIDKGTNLLTARLLSSSKGREIMRELLLGREVNHGRTKLYLARNLMKVDDDIVLTYQDVVNSCHFTRDANMTDDEVEKMKDKLAFDLVSGNN